MRQTRSKLRDDSAVSEAISYVLIFGLISLGTGIVVLQGGPAVDTREQQQINQNAENAVMLVQDRLDQMVQQNAPVREVSINLKDITVGVGGSVDPTLVNVTNMTSGESYRTAIDPVYVDTGSRTILYEGGAVMIGQRGIDESWAMSSDPSWAVRTNGSTGEVKSLFIRTISTVGNDQLAGEGRARWVFESAGETNENLLGVEDLNVTIKSPRAGPWERYFESLNSSITSEDILRSTPDDQATIVITDTGFEDGEGRVSYDETLLRTEIDT
jgi:hypothetical protein